MSTAPDRLLHNLARLYNVQTIYWDAFGRLIQPPADAVLRVLALLGAPLERLEDSADALRARRQYLWRRGIDPVLTVWDGSSLRIKLRVPAALASRPVRYRIELQTGEILAGKCRPWRNAAAGPTVEGVSYVTRRLAVADKLPAGYHNLFLRTGGLSFEALVLASLTQAYTSATAGERRWGLFCPLYALASESSWGAGEFTDLAAFADFTAASGGHVVGTLPLLSAFLDEPFNPSPYAPVSRIFWNEFYLDVGTLPELQHCPTARDMIRSTDFQRELETHRAAPFVEYRRIMALKRRVLEELLRSLLSQPPERRAGFEAFIATHSRADDYATFRAKTERERKPWEQWAESSRAGSIGAGEYDDAARLYHLFVQWHADNQMKAVAEKAADGGPGLYLDFPLGVNRDGYDVWRERDVFALAASGGAPPDGFFSSGQNWGFPPLHSENLRRQRYRYYVECVRHHLRYARMLRIDHVMGLHRSYWIPQGFEATDGVYVHYRAEEFYAILSLEAHRYRAEIVGENLGTVPPYVNQAMARHKIYGMHVSQFFVGTDGSRALPDVDPDTVASLNTHDTPTFAGFWNEQDIQDRIELGLLTDGQANDLRQDRETRREALSAFLASAGYLSEGTREPTAILQAWLNYLAGTSAAVLLVTLEDLWLEATPQNVPGTWEERPNWKRKARYALEQLAGLDSVTGVLKTIDDGRRRGR
jgi:4-alpha-glucanotransferase